MPDLVYMDDDLTIAQAVSAPVFSKPFSNLGVVDDLILTQDFWQLKANKVVLPLDTAHPDYATFLLAMEGPETDMGGNVVKWTRTYAKLPDSFTRKGGSIPYTFPAFNTGVLTTGRPPITLTVPTIVQYDFFRQADTSTIPVFQAQTYVLAGFPNYTAISSIFGSPVVADNTVFSMLTVPSLANYQVMITNGDLLVAIASEITPNWMGNIHMRKTIKVVAQ